MGHVDHLVRIVRRRHTGVSRQSPAVPGERSTAFRRQAARRERRRREGRRVLPVRTAPRADLPVFRHQSADGADADPHLDLLLGKSARDARWDDRVRKCRYAARQDRQRQRDPVTGDPWIFRLARGVSFHRQAGAGLDRGTQGVCPLATREAGKIRLQPAGDRCRIRRARLGIHRRRREGQGGARGKAQDGWRLPEYRLRAVQGTAALCQVYRPGEKGGATRHAGGQGGFPLCRPDAARPARGQGRRTARFRRALHQAWRRLHPGRGASDVPVDCRGRHAGWQARDLGQVDHHCRRCPPLRAADTGYRRGWLPDIRRRLGPAGSTQTPRRARWRTDRLRAGPGFCARRCQRDPGRNGTAADAARRPGDFRDGTATLRR